MPTLFLDINDKLLERSLKELFDPLPEFQWASATDADLTLTDHPLDINGNYLLLDKYPLVADKVIQDIRMIVEDGVVEFGPYQLDMRTKSLKGPNREDILTMKEAEVLYYMVKNRGQELSRDEILQQVWGYQADVDTHTLETHIYRLRQKLEKDPASPVILKSCEDGYVLAVG
jgi:hypothetical protein